MFPSDINRHRAVNQHERADHDEKADKDLEHVGVLVSQIVLIGTVFLGLICLHLSGSGREVTDSDSDSVSIAVCDDRVGEADTLVVEAQAVLVIERMLFNCSLITVHRNLVDLESRRGSNLSHDTIARDLVVLRQHKFVSNCQFVKFDRALDFVANNTNLFVILISANNRTLFLKLYFGSGGTRATASEDEDGDEPDNGHGSALNVPLIVTVVEIVSGELTCDDQEQERVEERRFIEVYTQTEAAMNVVLTIVAHVRLPCNFV